MLCVIIHISHTLLIFFYSSYLFCGQITNFISREMGQIDKQTKQGDKIIHAYTYIGPIVSCNQPTDSNNNTHNA